MNQLITQLQALPSHSTNHFVIAEIGFGSALNFLSAWMAWEKYAPPLASLYFIAADVMPISLTDLTRSLALLPHLQDKMQLLLNAYPSLTPGFHRLVFAKGRINLLLMVGDIISNYHALLSCGDNILEPALRNWSVNFWFLNGTEPSPELRHVMDLLSKNDTLNPPVKRIKRYTPWHLTLPIQHQKHAIILGAGLAGCCTAAALANRGWRVTLIDEAEEVGGGASGNQYAVLYPKFSVFHSPLNDFMLSAFIFAVRFYRELLLHFPIGELAGILQLPSKNQSHSLQLQAWFARYPALGRLVTAEQASILAGIDVKSAGVFVPDAGWIDLKALCYELIQTPGITLIAKTRVELLNYNAGFWSIDEHRSNVLVIANGFQANQFKETAHLPLMPVFGQMTVIASNDESSKLRLPLCGDGHIVPARLGMHGIGATYHPGTVITQTMVADDLCNLSKLANMPTDGIWSLDVIDHWSGIRAATPDYLPLVGPIADVDGFKQQLHGLTTDAKRWIPTTGAYYPGLYACTGFGSRGLTTIPLAAENLAAMLNHEPPSLPRSLLQALSPARFLCRSLSKNV